MNLYDIKDPSFLKNLKLSELKELSEDIRSFLIESLQKTGGHLSSNLGTVELIIALHYVFNSPKDAIIFDVGHQAYTHKILTGRTKAFDSLRQTDGLSGYINYEESIHDMWESGHAGTALSALYGLLYAKMIKQEDGEGIAVIGDASIMNGMSVEALNLLGNDPHKRGIIILNDNQMSISKSVGSLSKALTRFRSNKVVIKSKRIWQTILPDILIRVLSRIKRSIRTLLQRKNIFEDLGYMYIGPIDGHDLKGLIYNLKRISKIKKSVVLHILTDKGKGHKDAENDSIGTYHGVSKVSSKVKSGITWSQVIAAGLDQLQAYKKTFVIMPAMTVGTKMDSFEKKYPDRYFDIGIAEEHGATMAGMMAHQGVDVFYPIYATFSQRAFDQILNDIARSDHHVVFGIDRAGIVGEDGSTHQGLFDVSMFSLMPNVVITMPYDAQEAFDLLYYGFMNQNHPFVIRYPRGRVSHDEKSVIKFREIKPEWTYFKQGTDPLVVISYGPSLDLVKEAVDELKIDATIINARFIKPIDQNMLTTIFSKDVKVLVYEEISNTGGLYPMILKFMAKNNYKHKICEMSITDKVVRHGHYQDVLKKCQMDKASIIKNIKELML
ncbi:MAG: 1-deoxy-D-xylulose-5-phosphate synthase [Acholeplasmataceae bacterium]|nr:1-deoxy-D-xylulose-5-phosphate synthase [Acholeplasmataceae bacterium]